MSEDKPHDAVLQQQLDYFSDMVRRATNSKMIIIVSVCGDEGENVQASVQMPKPERRDDTVALEVQAGMSLITAAAMMIEDHTPGAFQLMIKMPDGELHPALSDDIERLMIKKGFTNV